MRTESINIYTFDELSPDAKERARNKHREHMEYPWFNDVISSLKSFCDEFGVTVTGYHFSDDYRASIDTDVMSSHFRGFKLKDFDREAMPTGFCFDNDLRYTFADEFKRTGNAYAAFDKALDVFLDAVRKDIQWHYSDECIDETIIANGYEFTENGEMY